MQNSDHLLELALLIVNFQNLSHLAIKNKGFFQYSKVESHQEFLHQISKIVRLKSLEINLQEEGAWSTSESQHGYLQAYANCVEALQELQDISFTHSKYEKKEELDLLVAVLKKKGSRIKSLHLKFMDRENEINYLKKFSRTFKKLKNLEELSTGGFFIKERGLQRFRKAILKLKWLRSLTLNPEDINLDLAAFTRIVREILMKKGLEEFKWIGFLKIKEKGAEEVEPIDIQKVLLRNPRLRKIDFPTFIFPSQIEAFINLEAIPVYPQVFP